MDISIHPRTQTNLQHKPPTIIYLRSARLSPADRSDLDAYAEMLRGYYGIPEGRPVFPKPRLHDRSKNTVAQKQQKKSRATGVNRADHPWRGTL